MNSRLLGMVTLAFCALAPVRAQEAATPLPELTLEAAASQALDNNAELAAMQAEVRMAAANLRLARAGRGLLASANVYASSATSPNMVAAPADVMPDDMRMVDAGQSIAGDVRVTKSLSTGGRIGSTITQRRWLVAATEADVAAMRLRVYYETRRMYRMVLLRQKLVEIRQREVDMLQELVRVDEVKLEAGKIPLYYYLRDKTRLAEAQQELVNAQRDVETGMYELSVMLGLDRPRQFRLTDVMGFVPYEYDEEAALRAAAAQRPELAAVRARIEAAGAEVSAARATYRPQVAATVILGGMLDSEGMSRGGYTAALVGSLPLIDAGTRQAEVAMAEAQQQQLTQQERRLAQVIARDVLVAQANLKAADQNVRTSLEVLAAAEEDYRVNRVRYDAGKAINLEPLDALASLVRARVNAAHAVYEYNNAVDALKWAQGTIAPTEPATPPPPKPEEEVH